MTQRKLRAVFWTLVIIFGTLQTWALRHYMSADGMSYLDIAEAYRRGDWSHALNAYWSPLYSWLVALLFILFPPGTYWEFAATRFLTLLIYLASFAAFELMLNELVAFLRQTDSPEPDQLLVPDWFIRVISYSLFLWAGLRLIGLGMGPDQCVAFFAYLTAAFVLKLRRGVDRWRNYLLLGVILGVSYYAKAILLPLAIVSLACCWFAITDMQKRVAPRLALILLIFAAISGPFMIALSRQKGRATFGEIGKLAYAWHANDVTMWIHWQGEGNNGQPRHPTRKLDAPLPMYEFASPGMGTYPPWYDPSYWYEGVKTRFAPRQQLRAFVENIRNYMQMFFHWQGGVIAIFLLFGFMAEQPSRLFANIARQWHLLLPAGTALFLYWLVLASPRYAGPFYVLLWLALFSALNGLHLPATKRLLRAGAAAILVPTLLVLTAFAWFDFRTSGFRERLNYASHPQWQVVESLRRLGVAHGDAIGNIGYTFGAYWAHLLRVQIVAEIPEPAAGDFWSLSATDQQRVLDLFAASGAKAVVADKMPAKVAAPGWHLLGDDVHVVYLFR